MRMKTRSMSNVQENRDYFENAGNDECVTNNADKDGAEPNKALNSTFSASSKGFAVTPKRETVATPKPRSKVYRFPTPHTKSRSMKLKFSEEKEEDEESEDNEDTNEPYVTFTTLETNRAVLRSIRKRPLAIDMNTDANIAKFSATRSNNRVTFHSPANMGSRSSSTDKLYRNTPVINEINVTKRRKRTDSFDEAILSQPDNPGITPRKIAKPSRKPSTTPKRSKLPNFAAIHEKHFNKMENLLDHVNRKTERAKALITSNTKTRTASSAHKGPYAPKGGPYTHSDSKDIRAAGPVTREKPKASRNIALHNFAAVHTTEDDDAMRANLLPNPRLAIIKPMSSTTKELFPKSAPTSAKKAPSALKQNNHVKKPAFNLSTAIKHQIVPKLSQLSAPTMNHHNQNASTMQGATEKENKVTARRQRHMEMFKGRNAGGRDANKNANIIRGVRSNRRFELQMQHRKNLEHNGI